MSSGKELMGQDGEDGTAVALPVLWAGCSFCSQSCQAGALLLPIYMELVGFFHHCWGTFSSLLAGNSRIFFTICVVDAVVAE